MIAYFDCFSGIAGDMTVGALLDAGVKWGPFQEELEKLDLDGYTLRGSSVKRSGISGTHFQVITDDPPSAHEGGEDHHHGRHLVDIEDLITRSTLAEPVKRNALAIFRKLGEAESRVHSVPVEEIHFHEVGAVDSIIDIVGACICLHILGVTRIFASPLPVGNGMVRTAHGLMPLPAPATAELCRGIPTYPVDVRGELVTPTGAAILATLAESFGPPPPMTAVKVGYGAGTKDFGERPNLLRVTLAEDESTAGWDTQDLLLLETNIDDLNPQVFEHVIDLCFAAGALDVTLSAIQMKKNRPATTLSVLCEPALREAMLGILAAETTTLGVRASLVRRYSLPREVVSVETPYGSVEVKVARLPGGGVKAHPEYASAREAARKASAPLTDVLRAAMEAYYAGSHAAAP